MAEFSPLETLKRMATSTGAPAAPATLGRFELQRVLGKGAQSAVWLGFDPRLERQVAIKVVRCTPGVDAAALQQWLQEARNVGRLTHRNIVPLFEADVHGKQPYLVFEYVPGRTLTEHLRARGGLMAREAVELMQGILAALQAAHTAGVVHRDLKPSNILIDADGQARVMDFGIAARISSGGGSSSTAGASGTPGYMAPESVSGAAPTPAMDVFSAGLVLAELLLGRPLVADTDPMRALYRIANEDLTLPINLDRGLDEHLRGIVLQSIARKPAQRYASAEVFWQSLQAWLKRSNGSTSQITPAAAGSSQGTLDFLLRRMRHKSDFPALSDSVARIQRLANSENESVGSLTNEILKDVALTNKLLRLVNSAHFTHAGGGSISTVSRAVALVGFNGIRNMALSLVLLDHMSDKQHANQLKEEFLRGLMAGSIANELCSSSRDSEEAFIGALFQNLGRLLTEFYFPEEARQIRKLVADDRHAGNDHAASVSVLGLSFEELGLGVARAWGLPDNLQRCMRKPVGKPPTQMPQQPQDRMRWLATAANEVADTLLHSDPEEAPARVGEVAERYARALGMKAREMQAATTTARQRLAEMADAMQLQVAPESPARRLLLDPPPPTTAESPADELATEALQATVAAPLPGPAAQTPAALAEQATRQITDVLVSGIQDITNAMVENFHLNQVIRMILETMLRALGLRRIVFCLRDAKTDTLTGRFGLGEGVETVIPAFRIPLKSTPDLFNVVCGKGVDTLISDAAQTHIAARLPPWYRQTVNAPTFLLLPLQLKGATFALIYADTDKRGGIAVDDKQLTLLRTLRNQAVMAFRQSN